MGFFPQAWDDIDNVLVVGSSVPSGLIEASAPIYSEYSPGTLPRLHEFDILVVDPLMSELAKDAALRGDSSYAVTDLIRFEVIRETFQRRRTEIEELLRTGGVVVVFVRPRSQLSAQFGPNEWQRLNALELIAPQYLVADLQLEAHSGRIESPIDSEDPMTPYLRLRPQYVATMSAGLLTDEAHGYPLAYTRDGLIASYVEYVGRGVLYWVPPPDTRTDEGWKVLLECARKAVRARGALLQAIADDAQINQLEGEAASSLRAHNRARDAIRDELRLREELLEQDTVLADAVRHFNTARSSTPRRALDHLSRMYEIIKRELGGQHEAAQTLGYHPDLPDAFTFPANVPAHQVRHASSGPAQPVSPEVLTRALKAANEILRLFFLNRRARFTSSSAVDVDDSRFSAELRGKPTDAGDRRDA